LNEGEAESVLGEKPGSSAIRQKTKLGGRGVGSNWASSGGDPKRGGKHSSGE